LNTDFQLLVKYIITEWWRLRGTSGRCLVQPLLEQGPLEAGGTQSHWSGGAYTNPESFL